MKNFTKHISLYRQLADVYVCYNKVTVEYLILTSVGLNSWYQAYGLMCEEILEVIASPIKKRNTLA